MENREMFEEINALIGAVAKALSMGETEVVAAVEAGELRLGLITDEQGRNCVEVNHNGKLARVYQGAVFRPDDKPETDDDCADGGGGCSCGH